MASKRKSVKRKRPTTDTKINDPPEENLCTICMKYFSESAELDRHTRSIHRGKMTFKCNKCDYFTESKSVLKRHLNIFNEKSEKLHRCNQCSFAFCSVQSLAHHVKNIHKVNIKPEIEHEEEIFQGMN